MNEGTLLSRNVLIDTPSVSTSLSSVPISPFLMKLTLKKTNSQPEQWVINDNLLRIITKAYLLQQFTDYFSFQLDYIVLKVSPFPSSPSNAKEKQFVFRGFVFLKFPPLPDPSVIEDLTYNAFNDDDGMDMYLQLVWDSEEFSMVKDVDVSILGVEQPSQSQEELPSQALTGRADDSNTNFIGLIVVFCMVVLLSVALITALFFAINRRRSDATSKSNPPPSSSQQDDSFNQNKNFSSPAKTAITTHKEVATPETYNSNNYNYIDKDESSSMSNSSNQVYNFSINGDDDLTLDENNDDTNTNDNYTSYTTDNYSVSTYINNIDIKSIQEMSAMGDSRFNAILNDEPYHGNDNHTNSSKHNNSNNDDDKNNTAFLDCSNSIWNDAETPSFELTENDSDSYLGSHYGSSTTTPSSTEDQEI